MNQTIRTVAIRNWPNNEFLHLVFLRLNTGTVKLSPQELRQAMAPGDFSDFVDDWSFNSKPIQRLLSRDGPDPRMRDVELLARHLALKNLLPEYGGRMKSFLDMAAERYNDEWGAVSSKIKQDAEAFDKATELLIDLFGDNKVARKQDSHAFNRAIFDALAFYAVRPEVMKKLASNKTKVVRAYERVLRNPEFQDAVESDTAGIPNTQKRLAIWGDALQKALSLRLPIPKLEKGTTDERQRIRI